MRVALPRITGAGVHAFAGGNARLGIARGLVFGKRGASRGQGERDGESQDWIRPLMERVAQPRKNGPARRRAATDMARPHLGEICPPLVSVRGDGLANPQKSTVKPLFIMLAGSVLTWAVVMIIHGF